MAPAGSADFRQGLTRSACCQPLARRRAAEQRSWQECSLHPIAQPAWLAALHDGLVSSTTVLESSWRTCSPMRLLWLRYRYCSPAAGPLTSSGSLPVSALADKSSATSALPAWRSSEARDMLRQANPRVHVPARPMLLLLRMTLRIKISMFYT